MAGSAPAVPPGAPSPTAAAPPAARTGRHPWLSVLWSAARTPRGAAGLTMALLVVLVAVIGPAVSPHSPTDLVTLTFAKPSGQFPLVAGAAAGIAAAYLHGAPDGIIMRTVDVILAFPQLVFALLLLSLLGPKLWLIVLAVGLSHAPAVARVIRSATLDIAERDYVKVAELQGMRPVKVMAKEILPNLISPLMVEAGLRLTYSIVIIAGLAFLGFGQPPPTANWGTMINENRIGLQLNPWAVIAPAVLIALLTVGTNTFTDAVARVTIGVDRRPEEAALLNDLGPEQA